MVSFFKRRKPKDLTETYWTPNPTACYKIISLPMKKAIDWAHTRHVQTIPNIWMLVIPCYIMLYPLTFKSNPVDIWAEKSVRRVCTIQRDTGSFSYKMKFRVGKKNDKMQVPTMDHFPDWSLKNAVLWISQFACLESIYLEKHFEVWCLFSQQDII